MDDLSLWFAVAVAGALHGVHPASGWPVVAAWRAQATDRPRAWRALLPMALGHLVSIGLLAGAVAAGASIDRTWAQAIAAALLLLLAVLHHLRRRLAGCRRTPARWRTGPAGLALWSFVVSSGHGAGLMLVPALLPLCAPASAEVVGTALWTALGAVGLHTVSMLLAAGVAADLAGRAVCVARRRSARRRAGHGLPD